MLLPMSEESLFPMSHWSEPNEELFRPTLRENDDAVGFDRPWNPWSLVMIAFFCGVIAGGGLLAFNFRRLGMKGKLYPVLAIVALVALAQAGLSLWLLGSGRLGAEGRDAVRTAQWMGRAVATLFAIALATPQQKRYRLFQASGLPGGHLLWPALAAIAAQFAFSLLWAAAAYVQIFFR
jgi:hypothetical protein